ncbi:NAD-dependent epimerase/dehydratase family protein [Roseomonas populi]|uniref:SDR family NAD(P)-dependent oxidoreductase n=1 Tax=Roseomonas populi TaxID=3121582 RepID=A0ABT1WZ23_9PROT|nr:NAD-dependent epimerase/dehydratase family protein [Roseomonas pecuniae]MCR0981101.1 SDR family NAD(P)-dependent oxidoreductase [Roseomonas pecuniae]
MDQAPLVAVTGGTGFLGQHAVAAFLAQGWRVRMLVRDGRRVPAAGAETVPGDLFDAAALRRLVEGAQAVVHLAGLTKARRATDFMAVNRDGSARLAQAVAAAAPEARCVILSSLAAREPGLSPYAASKRAGEEAAIAGLGPAGRWVVLRPTVIYGPGDREGLVLRQLAGSALVPAPRAPEPRITMVHARDVADALATLCVSGPLGEVFEVTDARYEGHGWRELLARIAGALGNRPRFVGVPDVAMLAAGAAADALARVTGRGGIFGLGKAREILHRDWSSSPARQLPGLVWSPRITFEEGLQDTLAWWASLGRGAARG